MSEILASLTKWFSERPQWLQIAATRLLRQPKLDEKDVSNLAALCKQEADGKLPKVTYSFPSSAFSQSAAGNFRLPDLVPVKASILGNSIGTF